MDPSTSRPDGDHSCPNCGAVAPGTYCASCGQAQERETPTLWRWLADTVSEVLALDGRLPRTLRALVARPGLLTVEWTEGRRARWVRPFRLYVFCSLAFFTVSLLLPMFAPEVEPGDLADPVAVVHEAGVDAAARDLAPAALFVLMPLFAVLLKGAFRRRRRLYLEHLVHSLHLHAFAFLLLAAVWIADRLPELATDIVETVLAVGLVGYVIVSLRRVYGLGWWRAVPAGVALFVVYSSFTIIAIGVAGNVGAERDGSLQRGASVHWEAREALAAGDTTRARRKEAEAVVRMLRSPGFSYDPHARYHMGRLLLDAGEPDGAAREAAQGLALHPTHLLLLGLAAEVADSLGNDGAAADHRRRLLEVREAELRDFARAYEGRHGPEVEAYVERARRGN